MLIEWLMQGRNKGSTLPTHVSRFPMHFVAPLRLPGEEKGSGDEVGKHAQLVFCELHKMQQCCCQPYRSLCPNRQGLA